MPLVKFFTPPPLLRTHPKATPEDTSKAGGERFLSLRRLVPLLSTAWMTSDLQHPRGKNVKSQWTLFSRLQAFCRPVQLPVSIPSKLTVKFSNGWGMTTIQLHWDRFYLRDPVCQTWRVCLQHQTDWRPLCHATVNLTAAVDVTVVKQACLSLPCATLWDSHTKTPWHWLSFFFFFRTYMKNWSLLTTRSCTCKAHCNSDCYCCRTGTPCFFIWSRTGPTCHRKMAVSDLLEDRWEHFVDSGFPAYFHEPRFLKQKSMHIWRHVWIFKTIWLQRYISFLSCVCALCTSVT